MTDANGWPDAAREAVYLALRDRIHGLLDWGGPPEDWTEEAKAVGDLALTALAPFVAAREEAEAQAMREACARRVDDDGIGDPRDRQLRAYLAGQVRALPLPAPNALARIEAEAEARGMVRAAGIAAANGNEPTQRNLTDYQAGGRDMADTIAAAIRAMAEEAGDE